MAAAGLLEIANRIEDARRRSEKEMSAAAGPLFEPRCRISEALVSRIDTAPINSPVKEDLLDRLREKQQQLQTSHKPGTERFSRSDSGASAGYRLAQ